MLLLLLCWGERSGRRGVGRGRGVWRGLLALLFIHCRTQAGVL